MDSEERKQYFDEIAQLPERMERAVQGLTDSQLDTPYRAGAWTVRQVVHHVADSHMNGYIRMKLAMTENHPTIRPYQQDDWAKLPDAAGFPVDVSIYILKHLHRRWVDLLMAMPEDTWKRTLFHPESGDLTLEDMLLVYARHGNSHLGSIVGLREEKGW